MICHVLAFKDHIQFIGICREMSELFCERDKILTFLINRRAARKGHTAIIQLLLQTGQVNVNTADFKGLTALMTASMYGRTISACYLLGMGAQVRLEKILS